MAGFPYSALSNAFFSWSKSPMVGLPAREIGAAIGAIHAMLADSSKCIAIFPAIYS